MGQKLDMIHLSLHKKVIQRLVLNSWTSNTNKAVQTSATIQKHFRSYKQQSLFTNFLQMRYHKKFWTIRIIREASG